MEFDKVQRFLLSRLGLLREWLALCHNFSHLEAGCKAPRGGGVLVSIQKLEAFLSVLAPRTPCVISHSHVVVYVKFQTAYGNFQ